MNVKREFDSYQCGGIHTDILRLRPALFLGFVISLTFFGVCFKSVYSTGFGGATLYISHFHSIWFGEGLQMSPLVLPFATKVRLGQKTFCIYIGGFSIKALILSLLRAACRPQ